MGFWGDRGKRKCLRTIIEHRSEHIAVDGETKVTRRHYISSQDCTAKEFDWTIRGR